MKKKLFLLLCTMLYLAGAQGVHAAAIDYLTGWTEVTSLPTDNSELNQYYYVFVATEADLMLAQEFGTGKIADGPEASNPQEGELTMVYRTPSNPLIAKKFVWMLSYDNTYLYGIRNLNNSTYYMQSRGSWPWRVQFAWETAQSKWTQWQFAYADSKWTIQNKLSAGDGGGDTYYIGPWIAKAFKDNNVVAGNKEGENVGKFKIYRISRQDFKAPTDVTSTYLTNPGFDKDDKTVDDASATGEFVTNWKAVTISYGRYGIYDSSKGSDGTFDKWGVSTASDGKYYLRIRNNYNDQTKTQNIQQNAAMNLPKGKYNISFDYKVAKRSDADLNLTVSAKAGSTTKASKVIAIPQVAANTSYFSSIGWTKGDFDLTLDNPTDIVIDITCDTRGASDGATAALLDNFVVNYYNINGPNLIALIAQATSINESTGDLTDAIAAAQAVYDGINNTPAYQATIDDAISTLKTAITSSVAGITKNDGDDLSYLIANNGFELSSAITENKSTSTTFDYATSGWLALSTTTATSCGAVVAYGSDKTLNGVTAPTADNNGNPGNALGVSVGWNTTVAYQTAPITLPAGFYRLVIRGFNKNNSGTSFESKFGFVPTAGDSYISAKTSFASNKWETDEVEFTLSEPTEGVFQIGGKAGNNTSTTHAKVFLDNISLTYYSDAITYKTGVIIANKGDITSLINGTFDTNADGWKDGSRVSNSRTWHGATANGYYERTTAGTMSCTLPNMPAGTYKVVAAWRSINGGQMTPAIAGTNGTTVTGTGDAAPEEGTTEINLNGVEMPYSSLGGFTTDANGHNWHWITATGTLAVDGDLVLSFTTSGTAGWNAIDDVHLYCTNLDETNYTTSLNNISANADVANAGGGVVTCDITVTNPNVIFKSNSGSAITTAAGQALNNCLYQTSAWYMTKMVLYDGYAFEDYRVSHGGYQYFAQADGDNSCTLYRNIPANTWCTIVLPFWPRTTLEKKYPSSLENGVLSFSDATTATCWNDEPMLIRSSVELNAITGKRQGNTKGESSGITYGDMISGEGAPMVGTYSNIADLSAVTGTNYVVGNDGELHKVTGAVTVSPFRAYFSISSTDVRNVISMNFDGDFTAINAIEAAEAEANAQKDGKYLIGNKIVIVKNGVKYDANGKKLN